MTATLDIPDFRFYISVLSQNDDPVKIADDFKEYFKDTDLSDKSFEYIKLNNLNYKDHKFLGVICIKIGKINITSNPKPEFIFGLSNLIQSKLDRINKEKPQYLYDTLNIHPYALIIASKLNNGENDKILWTPEKIYEYRKLLGSWIEYYSGQWEDYSDELYMERISHNLSNRLSELHYIRSNSAFIYMPRDDPRWKTWMEYMEDKFINQILQSRAILYVLMLLNFELDSVTRRIRDLVNNKNLALLKKEVKLVESLHMAINEITSQLNQERLMNRLFHSTRVVKRCFEVFSLDAAFELTQNKMTSVQDAVENEYINAQNQVQNQQKKYVLILNALIGSQVLFTIKDTLMNFDIIKNSIMLQNIVTYTTWFILIVLILFSVVGLGYSYLKSNTTLFAKEE